MLELYKMINGKLTFVDYGIKSKWQLYIRMGFMIKEHIKRVVKRIKKVYMHAAKLTMERIRRLKMDGAIFVINKHTGRLQYIALPVK